jgi:ATP-binding protein involved in chromosome partitioning
MKIAIPLSEGKLFAHFGHCSAFALIDADEKAGTITGRKDVAAPPHEPGLLPVWLAERGVNLVMTGGIGPRAEDLLTQHGIKVIAGAPVETPEVLIASYFAGTLSTRANDCDHDKDHGHSC